MLESFSVSRKTRSVGSIMYAVNNGFFGVDGSREIPSNSEFLYLDGGYGSSNIYDATMAESLNFETYTGYPFDGFNRPGIGISASHPREPGSNNSKPVHKNGGGKSVKRGVLGAIVHPSGSKDGHTKVATSRGLRDRRIRLSFETAIKFFLVQDRLGYDQPGKALEWLLEKCRSAIDELPAIPSVGADQWVMENLGLGAQPSPEQEQEPINDNWAGEHICTCLNPSINYWESEMQSSGVTQFDQWSLWQH